MGSCQQGGTFLCLSCPIPATDLEKIPKQTRIGINFSNSEFSSQIARIYVIVTIKVIRRWSKAPAKGPFPALGRPIICRGVLRHPTFAPPPTPASALGPRAHEAERTSPEVPPPFFGTLQPQREGRCIPCRIHLVLETTEPTRESEFGSRRRPRPSLRQQ